MPSASVPKLSGAVGQSPRPDGKAKVPNKKSDVELVQKLLTGAGLKVKATGKADKATVDAILKFQKTVVKLKDPDGVVDVNEITYKTLVKRGEKKASLGPAPKKVAISYTVPAIKQPTTMSCWATAIAMMLGWKKSMSFDPKTIADELGYTKQFKSGGLHPEDTKVFKHWGLRWDAPMCYSVQGFADTLKAYGPVWLAGNPKAPHVRVVTGMKGDGTPKGTKVMINDPAGGKKYTREFIKVMGKMEELGAKEAKMAKPIYVAHF